LTAASTPAPRPRWLRFLAIGAMVGALWWADRQHGAHEVRLLMTLPAEFASQRILTVSVQHPDGRERLRSMRARETTGTEWVVPARLERGAWQLLLMGAEGGPQREGRLVVEDDEYVEVEWAPAR